MQRREFLSALGLLPFISLTPQLAVAASAAQGYRNLLILIELKGGNDGLNTVVPYADATYYRLRPRIAINRDAVLQLDQRMGLHPSLQALMPLWKGGELAVVQGVGYAQPNLSHFRSIEIWDTASQSNEYLEQGWLTRVFQKNPAPAQYAADGVVIGSHDMGPLMGAGTRTVALRNTEQFLRQARLADDVPAKTQNAALAHILKVETDIVQAAQGLSGNYAFRTEFPKNQFGNSIKTAANVVAGKSGVAVLRITHNGFDTHNNQPNTQQRLLKELGEGLVALKTALQELGRWDSTLIMTYAEFGRRAQENGSQGTDHGTANTHFVLGGKVRGGLLGQAPDLQQLEGGNLRHQIDFRSLYATAIEQWWGLDARAALRGKYPTLDVLRA